MLHTGTLFDAWLDRKMSIHDRVLAALRARFWLHIWRQHILKLSSRFPDLYSTARSFISPASFRIFNRICDSLILLAIIYSSYYPTHPFCPWLLGTEFVEHFFGLARMLLPNFTYAEFLKMVQHIMVRQKILLSGDFQENRERDSAVGYIMDYDATPLTAKDQQLATVMLNNQTLDQLVVLAYREAASLCKELLHIPASFPTATKPLHLISLNSQITGRKSKAKPTGVNNSSESHTDSESDLDLDEDLDSDVEDHADQDMGENIDINQSMAAAARDTARLSALEHCDDFETVDELADPTLTASGLSITRATLPKSSPSVEINEGIKANPIRARFTSQILDNHGHPSVSRMLENRRILQSGTTAKSERIVKLNPKFELARIVRETSEDGKTPKMSIKEAAHRVRVLQDLDRTVKEPKKVRELRWQTAADDIRLIVSPKG